MKTTIIFNLHQTLVDSRSHEVLRQTKLWGDAFSRIKDLVPYSEVEEVLQVLQSKQISVAVHSDSPSEYAKAIFTHCYPRFCRIPVYGYHDTVDKYPDVYPFETIRRALSVSVASCIVVADRPDNIVNAKKCGMLAVAALWGTEFALVDILTVRPSFLARRPSEILSILKLN